jgi:hypothetical protein
LEDAESVDADADGVSAMPVLVLVPVDRWYVARGNSPTYGIELDKWCVEALSCTTQHKTTHLPLQIGKHAVTALLLDVVHHRLETGLVPRCRSNTKAAASQKLTLHLLSPSYLQLLREWS